MNKNDLHEYVEFAERLNSENRVVAFPSIGEYLIYDELAYMMLIEDRKRMDVFKKVIFEKVAGKTVFDIGTGEKAPLAVMSIEAGAKQVYAVEIDERVAKKAKQHIKKLGLSRKINVIHGDSIHVDFPKKVDVCIAEIIGNIGGAEGAPVILKNAIRFLNTGSNFIPEACITKIAPAMLPEHIYSDDTIKEISDYYISKIYKKNNSQFPFTRYVYYNFPPDHIISEPEIFENDNFNSIIFPEFTKTIDFEVIKEGSFDGFLLWINLHIDADHVIDSLNSKCVWAPVFLKTESIPVKKGDIIQANCERKLSSNQVNPDYFIHGTVKLIKKNKNRRFKIDARY